jgi:hypothetical protein
MILLNSYLSGEGAGYFKRLFDVIFDVIVFGCSHNFLGHLYLFLGNAFVETEK